MGCDIHSVAEKKNSDGDWWPISIYEFRKIGNYTYPYETLWQPFKNRDYNIFGFLAGVRNYGLPIIPLDEPRGRAEDSPAYSFMYEYHCDLNYEDDPEEPRCSYENWDSDFHSHSWVLVSELNEFDYSKPAGNGMTYRELLGDDYFIELQKCVDRGTERIVFWFDN